MKDGAAMGGSKLAWCAAVAGLKATGLVGVALVGDTLAVCSC